MRETDEHGVQPTRDKFVYALSGLELGRGNLVVAGAAFLVRAGSYTTVNMAEKRGHPSDATETSSDPTTLPTSSSQAGDIILTTKALQESTLEDSTRYAAHTRTPAVHPTISGLSTRSCSHQDRL